MGRRGSTLPLLHTPALNQPSVLTADALMGEVRRTRGLRTVPVPPVCVLDFDGDLFGGLVHDGTAQPVAAWACFHTPWSATPATTPQGSATPASTPTAWPC
jgi:hypothetical protein